jgi:fumarate reductase subunit C
MGQTMGASENTEAVEAAAGGLGGSRSFMFEGGQAAPAVTWEQSAGLAWRPGKVARPSMASSVVEAATSLSGIGLAIFMVMHMGLLFSVLLGTGSFDGLASFLEGYYLLHIAAPFLVLLIIAHIALTVRRAPATFRQQGALMRQLGQMRHLDTYTWVLQVVSGVALVALAAIHLWVVLGTLPIEAVKSGARVNDHYLWLYIPFVLLVEGHISLGLYRIAVKWGILERLRAHLILLGYSAVFLGLGFAILASFYRI